MDATASMLSLDGARQRTLWDEPTSKDAHNQAGGGGGATVDKRVAQMVSLYCSSGATVVEPDGPTLPPTPVSHATTLSERWHKSWRHGCARWRQTW